MSANKEMEILRVAENLVREGGYRNFSFREIAKAVGIKSSSVHYHFPTKADLGVAVARAYTNRFIANLGTPEQLVKDGKDPIAIYIESYKTALFEDKKMCLCGVLGAEIDSLPPEVAAETKIFFEKNIQWLTKAYELKGVKKKANDRAMQALALLEGAMMVGKVMPGANVFDNAVEMIMDKPSV